MKKAHLSLAVGCLFLSLTAWVSGCSSPAGKAATYKAKDISPVHDTKAEKASKKVDKLKR